MFRSNCQNWIFIRKSEGTLQNFMEIILFLVLQVGINLFKHSKEKPKITMSLVFIF